MNRVEDSSDMKMEILSRLPLKTLARCRMFSKEVNRLSYESSFMHLHCERTNTITGYFFQTLDEFWSHSTFVSVDNPSLTSNLTLDFLRSHPKILSCSYGGLILCMGHRFHLTVRAYYICKPSTGQFRTIPTPPSDGLTTKMAMMVLGLNPLRFKVVHIFKPDSDQNKIFEPKPFNYSGYCCEVFDSDTWAWKQLNDLMLPDGELFHSNQEAVSVSDGLHWLTSNSNKKNEKNLLSFYQDMESWEFVPLPESMIPRTDPSSSWVRLAKYEGQLAVIYEKSGTNVSELWARDSYVQKLWSKTQELDLKACKAAFPASKAESFYNSDTLFLTGDAEAIFYNFKTEKFERFELQYHRRKPTNTFFIQTDYEPINLY